MNLVGLWPVQYPQNRDRIRVPVLAGGFLTTKSPGRSTSFTLNHWFQPVSPVWLEEPPASCQLFSSLVRLAAGKKSLSSFSFSWPLAILLRFCPFQIKTWIRRSPDSRKTNTLTWRFYSTSVIRRRLFMLQMKQTRTDTLGFLFFKNSS